MQKGQEKPSLLSEVQSKRGLQSYSVEHVIPSAGRVLAQWTLTGEGEEGAEGEEGGGGGEGGEEETQAAWISILPAQNEY